MKVWVESELCIGAGKCVRHAPAAFALDAEGIVRVTDPARATTQQLCDAADDCPAGAIFVERAPDHAGTRNPNEFQNDRGDHSE
jgi:ferredoxin